MKFDVLAMRVALRELGHVDMYHMDSCMENPPDGNLWANALDPKFNGKGRTFETKDWDQLLGHCQVSESNDTRSASGLSGGLQRLPDG